MAIAWPIGVPAGFGIGVTARGRDEGTPVTTHAPDPAAQPLLGQAALVTGASRGIGRAIAERFAAAGAAVALLARAAEPLRDVAQAIRDAGGRAEAVAADIRDERQVRAAVERLAGALGRLDILVNNAGIAVWGPVQGFALADWERTLATNLTGPFLMARAVLPVMIPQGGGQILNVASGAARGGLANLAAYSASKAGLMAFSEALASEVREHRIKVMVLAPGSVATGFGEGFPAGRPGRSKHPLQPADVAAAALAMVTQPPHAWVSEAILRPLTLT